MKRVGLLLIVVLNILLVKAQDFKVEMDYTQNHALLNPAYLAKNTFVTFNLSVARYWLYPDAPSQSTLWFSTRYRAMGFGVQFGGYTEGTYKRMNMAFDYVFDVVLSKRQAMHLSFGIKGAFMQDFFNINEMTTLQPDPLLQNQRLLMRFYPQLAIGSMFYTEKFEFGIAMTRILPYSGYQFFNWNYVQPAVMILHAGYFYKDFPLERYLLNPEMVIFISRDLFRIDLNGFLYLWKSVKFGGGVFLENFVQQKIGALSGFASVGFKIAGRFYVNYQLDFNRINLPTPLFTKLGSKISLRFDIYPYEKDVPRFF